MSCKLGCGGTQECTKIDCQYSRESHVEHVRIAGTSRTCSPDTIDNVYKRIVRNTLRVTRDQTRGLTLLSDVRLAIEAGEMLAKATTANSVTESRLASIQAGGVAAFQSISQGIYRTPHIRNMQNRSCHTRISVRLI